MSADEATCPRCGGEMIQYEDGPDDTLECAWCIGAGPNWADRVLVARTPAIPPTVEREP